MKKYILSSNLLPHSNVSGSNQVSSLLQCLTDLHAFGQNRLCGL